MRARVDMTIPEANALLRHISDEAPQMQARILLYWDEGSEPRPIGIEVRSGWQIALVTSRDEWDDAKYRIW